MVSFHAVNPLPALGDIFLSERARWVLWLPVALAVGIVIYFNLPYEPSVWVLAALPVFGTLAWIVRERIWPLAVALFIVAVMLLGFAAALIETRLDARPMLNRTYGPVPIAGRVAGTEIMPDGIRVTLSHLRITGVGAPDNPEKIRIKFRGLGLQDAPPTGAAINLYGDVGPFSGPVAPGAMDFRRQAYFKHLGGLGWSYGKIRIIETDPPVLAWHEKASLMFERARKRLAQDVYRHLTGDIAAMTATRLNGEQTAISPPVIEAMRIAGLSHLLSTSGFHVTIMALLIYFPVRAGLALIPWLALRYPIKKWAAGVAIFSALGYTLLVGSQAATLRSLIMTALAMLAILTDRRAAALRLVMLSAAIGMLLAPDATLGPSFQMSFAAVFCLVAFNPKAWDWASGDFSDFLPEWFRSVTAHLWGIARTSLIATVATTPFSIYHFQSFSLYGFAANMAAIPVTSFWIMPMILLAYLTAPLHVNGWFIEMAGIGTALTIRIAEAVAAWPKSIFYWPAMPGWVLLVICLGGFWLCIWREKWRWAGLLPILLGMLYPLYVSPPDLFIAPDGKEWGARLQDGSLAVANLKHAKFVTDEWRQRLGDVPMVDARDLEDNSQMQCDDIRCVYVKGARRILLPVDADGLQADCQGKDLVIAPLASVVCAAPMIDASVLLKHGSVAVYLKDKRTYMDFARARYAARPWDEGWVWKDFGHE